MLALALLVPLAAAPATPVPLPHAPGDGVVRLRSDTFFSLWSYDDDGNLVRTDPPFTREAVTVTAEAGIAPHLTLDAAVPFVFLPDRPSLSTGDFDIGGILTVVDAPVTLAATLDVKAPLYAGSPTVRGRAKDGKPAVGDGQADVTAAGLFVADLPFDGAMDLYAGYRFRGGGISDAVVGGGRVGLWFFDRGLFASAVLDTVVTFAAGPDEVVGAGFAALGPKVSVRLLDGVFLDVDALYVGRGQNAPGGFSLGAGASARF